MDEYFDDQTSASTWLHYAFTRSITPAFRRQFLQHFQDPQELAQLLRTKSPNIQTTNSAFNDAASKLLKKRHTTENIKSVNDALKWQQSHPANHIIGLDHPAYPKSLLATSDAPPVLYAMGNIENLNSPCVAMVGARKATHAALEIAREIAQDLAKSGITVVSGLALGIDSAAHQGALHGAGGTIAVSATGPDRIYPRTHQKLAHDITQNRGTIVTEFPLHTTLQPHCFPRRNRIISGISLGVIVVEAALPSGSLTTAQHALRQGREVMAVPGSVNNPMTRGCHELLKNGAALIESADDVRNCLSTELQRHLSSFSSTEPATGHEVICKKLTNMSPDAITLLKCVGFDPVAVDTLIQRSGLNAAQVAGALTHLELSGVIVADYAGRYTRCKPISPTSGRT